MMTLCSMAQGLCAGERKGTNMRKIVTLLAAGMLSLAATMAQAETGQLVERFSPASVGAALERYNLSFEQQRDRNGDPLLIVRPGELVHDQGMAVIFYDCNQQDTCSTVTLYTFFKTSGPLDPEIYHIWNDIFRVRTWTKAFKDTDGDTGFVLNVNAVGGVGSQSFEFLVGVFLTEMNAFKDALSGMANGATTSAQLQDTETWSDIFNDTFGAMALKEEGAGDLPIIQKEAPKDLLK